MCGCGPNSVIGVLTGRDKETHRQKRQFVRMEAEVRFDMATSQGAPRREAAPRSWKRPGADSPSEPPVGTILPHLELGCVPP